MIYTLRTILLLLIFAFGASVNAEDVAVPGSADSGSPSAIDPTPIAPARTTNTGLLLEPDLDLSSYTHKKFAEQMATVGAGKIQKKWTRPVVKLPPHPRKEAKGLTEAEVKAYMQQVKKLFDEGNAIPVSDVGLISTQEDVIRRPMLNHISGFENSTVRVFLLVQKTSTDKSWGYYSIVQDMTVDPPLDYYGHITPQDVKFEGTSCYKCHSSGPLAIHPAREDLVLDAKLAAALSEYIAEQPRSQFYFPEHSPKPKTGKPMKLESCTSCHDEDGDRGPLYQVHFHPIRIMVDYGYMPPGERLSSEEIAELKAWLESK